jgi:hypothetical protein
MDMSQVILNLVLRKKNGVRTSAVQEIGCKLILCYCYLRILWGGGVPKRQWDVSIPFYRLCCRRVPLALAAILYLVTLAENRWQQERSRDVIAAMLLANNW